MSTQPQDPTTTNKRDGTLVTDAKEAAEKVTTKARPLISFWTKFSNDWSFNLAAALAYNLLMSIFPIALALLAILGLVVGALNHATYVQLTQNLARSLPSFMKTALQGTLTKQQHQLALQSMILAIFSIVLAVYNGSRLFTLIEGCFGIIYRVRQRAFIPQNVMAFGMLILFIILIPIMVATATLPTLVATLLKSVLGNFPGTSILIAIGGILGGLISSYLLFQAIFLIVPNQRISWKHSWRGSLTAAILLELFLILFPLYVAHFLTGYAASIGTVIILLIFFYYFAIILLLGAEVNAFFGEGITNPASDVVTLVKEAANNRAQTQHPTASTASDKETARTP
jgi:membrane protein